MDIRNRLDAQWPGVHLPFGGRAYRPIEAAAAWEETPDHHSQLEDLISHVRRCERWARLDDRIDLSWRLDGGGKGS